MYTSHTLTFTPTALRDSQKFEDIFNMLTPFLGVMMEARSDDKTHSMRGWVKGLIVVGILVAVTAAAWGCWCYYLRRRAKRREARARRDTRHEGQAEGASIQLANMGLPVYHPPRHSRHDRHQ